MSITRLACSAVWIRTATERPQRPSRKQRGGEGEKARGGDAERRGGGPPKDGLRREQSSATSDSGLSRLIAIAKDQTDEGSRKGAKTQRGEVATTRPIASAVNFQISASIGISISDHSILIVLRFRASA